MPREHPPGNQPGALVPIRQPVARRGDHPDAPRTLSPDRFPARFQPRGYPRHQLDHPGPPGNHRTFPARRRPRPVRVSRLQSMGRGHLGFCFAASRRGPRTRGLRHPAGRPTRACRHFGDSRPPRRSLDETHRPGAADLRRFRETRLRGQARDPVRW